MEEKKTPRAKLHEGGHSRHSRHKNWMSHRPHPKFTGSQNKFS